MPGRHLILHTRRSLVAVLLVAIVLQFWSAAGPVSPAHADDSDDDQQVSCPTDPRSFPFGDVPETATHRTAIACLAEEGILLGVARHAYGPGRAVTRAQMATFLARMLLAAGDELPTGTSRDFRDLGGSPHARNIEALTAIGIVRGTSPGIFSPHASVTRAQMATFISQLLDELGIDLTGTGPAFVDVSPRSTHADAIAELAGEQIVVGRTRERFDPSGDVTREQMASFLLRARRVARGEAALDAPAPASRDTTSDDPRTRGVAHGVELRLADVGVVSKQQLTASGPVTTSHDGQVIEGRDIQVSGRDRYAVVVAHDDVVVRNNRIRFPDGGQGIRVEDDADRVLIEHNQLDAVYLSDVAKGHLSTNNNVGQRGMSIHGVDATVRRNHLVFVRSGIQLRGDGAVVTENFVEELANADEHSPDQKPLHGTGVSMPGDIRDVVVARNRVPSGSSGGIIIYAQGGPVQNVTVRDNLLVGTGEGFAIRGGRTHLSQDHYDDNHDIRIDNNRFSGTFGFPRTLGDGTNAAVDLSLAGNSFERNRWVGSNSDLPARCGTTRDSCD